MLAYGDFTSAVINFLIVAIALFIVIKAINTMNRKPPPKPAAPPPSEELVLLAQIRDLLAKAPAAPTHDAPPL